MALSKKNKYAILLISVYYIIVKGKLIQRGYYWFYKLKTLKLVIS